MVVWRSWLTLGDCNYNPELPARGRTGLPFQKLSRSAESISVKLCAANVVQDPVTNWYDPVEDRRCLKDRPVFKSTENEENQFIKRDGMSTFSPDDPDHDVDKEAKRNRERVWRTLYLLLKLFLFVKIPMLTQSIYQAIGCAYRSPRKGGMGWSTFCFQVKQSKVSSRELWWRRCLGRRIDLPDEAVL